MARKSLVVLAAGIGSRYGGLKQMDPMGPSGEFIIDYSAFDAMRAGFDRIVFLISRKIEADFKATVGARIGKHIEVAYAFQDLSAVPEGFSVPAERTKPWGTAHAVLSCAGVVNEPFGVVNADDFYGRDSYAALGRFLEQTAGDDALYAMVGFILRNTISEYGTVARGICSANPDGTLKTVVERTKIEKTATGARFLDDAGQWQPLTGGETVSMNMWGFKPGIFGHLRKEFVKFMNASGKDLKAEFFVPSVVNALMEEGKIRTALLGTTSPWFGVTYAQEKPQVVERIRTLVKEGVYPAQLWS